MALNKSPSMTHPSCSVSSNRPVSSVEKLTRQTKFQTNRFERPHSLPSECIQPVKPSKIPCMGFKSARFASAPNLAVRSTSPSINNTLTPTSAAHTRSWRPCSVFPHHTQSDVYRTHQRPTQLQDSQIKAASCGSLKQSKIPYPIIKPERPASVVGFDVLSTAQSTNTMRSSSAAHTRPWRPHSVLPQHIQIEAHLPNPKLAKLLDSSWKSAPILPSYPLAGPKCKISRPTNTLERPLSAMLHTGKDSTSTSSVNTFISCESGITRSPSVNRKPSCIPIPIFSVCGKEKLAVRNGTQSTNQQSSAAKGISCQVETSTPRVGEQRSRIPVATFVSSLLRKISFCKPKVVESQSEIMVSHTESVAAANDIMQSKELSTVQTALAQQVIDNNTLMKNTEIPRTQKIPRLTSLAQKVVDNNTLRQNTKIARTLKIPCLVCLDQQVVDNNTRKQNTEIPRTQQVPSPTTLAQQVVDNNSLRQNTEIPKTHTFPSLSSLAQQVVNNNSLRQNTEIPRTEKVPSLTSLAQQVVDNNSLRQNTEIPKTQKVPSVTSLAQQVVDNNTLRQNTEIPRTQKVPSLPSLVQQVVDDNTLRQNTEIPRTQNVPSLSSLAQQVVDDNTLRQNTEKSGTQKVPSLSSLAQQVVDNNTRRQNTEIPITQKVPSLSSMAQKVVDDNSLRQNTEIPRTQKVPSMSSLAQQVVDNNSLRQNTEIPRTQKVPSLTSLAQQVVDNNSLRQNKEIPRTQNVPSLSSLAQQVVDNNTRRQNTEIPRSQKAPSLSSLAQQVVDDNTLRQNMEIPSTQKFPSISPLAQQVVDDNTLRKNTETPKPQKVPSLAVLAKQVANDNTLRQKSKIPRIQKTLSQVGDDNTLKERCRELEEQNMGSIKSVQQSVVDNKRLRKDTEEPIAHEPVSLKSLAEKSLSEFNIGQNVTIEGEGKSKSLNNNRCNDSRAFKPTRQTLPCPAKRSKLPIRISRRLKMNNNGDGQKLTVIPKSSSQEGNKREYRKARSCSAKRRTTGSTRRSRPPTRRPLLNLDGTDHSMDNYDKDDDDHYDIDNDDDDDDNCDCNDYDDDDDDDDDYDALAYKDDRVIRKTRSCSSKRPTRGSTRRSRPPTRNSVTNHKDVIYATDVDGDGDDDDEGYVFVVLLNDDDDDDDDDVAVDDNTATTFRVRLVSEASDSGSKSTSSEESSSEESSESSSAMSGTESSDSCPSSRRSPPPTATSKMATEYNNADDSGAEQKQESPKENRITSADKSSFRMASVSEMSSTPTWTDYSFSSVEAAERSSSTESSFVFPSPERSRPASAASKLSAAQAPDDSRDELNENDTPDKVNAEELEKPDPIDLDMYFANYKKMTRFPTLQELALRAVKKSEFLAMTWEKPKISMVRIGSPDRKVVSPGADRTESMAGFTPESPQEENKPSIWSRALSLLKTPDCVTPVSVSSSASDSSRSVSSQHPDDADEDEASIKDCLVNSPGRDPDQNVNGTLRLKETIERKSYAEVFQIVTELHDENKADKKVARMLQDLKQIPQIEKEVNVIKMQNLFEDARLFAEVLHKRAKIECTIEKKKKLDETLLELYNEPLELETEFDIIEKYLHLDKLAKTYHIKRNFQECVAAFTERGILLKIDQMLLRGLVEKKEPKIKPRMTRNALRLKREKGQKVREDRVNKMIDDIKYGRRERKRGVYFTPPVMKNYKPLPAGLEEKLEAFNKRRKYLARSSFQKKLVLPAIRVREKKTVPLPGKSKVNAKGNNPVRNETKCQPTKRLLPVRSKTTKNEPKDLKAPVKEVNKEIEVKMLGKRQQAKVENNDKGINQNIQNRNIRIANQQKGVPVERKYVGAKKAESFPNKDHITKTIPVKSSKMQNKDISRVKEEATNVNDIKVKSASADYLQKKGNITQPDSKAKITLKPVSKTDNKMDGVVTGHEHINKSDKVNEKMHNGALNRQKMEPRKLRQEMPQEGKPRYNKNKLPPLSLQSEKQSQAKLPPLSLKPGNQVQAKLPPLSSQPGKQDQSKLPKLSLNPGNQVQAKLPPLSSQPEKQGQSKLPKLSLQPGNKVQAQLPPLSSQPGKQGQSKLPKLSLQPGNQVQAKLPPLSSQPEKQGQSKLPKLSLQPGNQVQAKLQSASNVVNRNKNK